MRQTNEMNLKMRVAAAASAVALASVGLMACSASVDGGSPDAGLLGSGGKPVESAFNHVVAGPALDGEWQSGCVRDKWDFQGATYEKINVKVAGQTFARTTTKYSDAYCTAAKNTLSGSALFRYAKKYANDVYEVEYRIAAGSRGFPGGDNVKRVGDRLYMSNGYLGELVDPDIEFRLVR